MPNLGPLAYSVWAVGGVVRKSVCAFYIRKKSVINPMTAATNPYIGYEFRLVIPEPAPLERTRRD